MEEEFRPSKAARSAGSLLSEDNHALFLGWLHDCEIIAIGNEQSTKLARGAFAQFCRNLEQRQERTMTTGPAVIREVQLTIAAGEQSVNLQEDAELLSVYVNDVGSLFLTYRTDNPEESPVARTIVLATINDSLPTIGDQEVILIDTQLVGGIEYFAFEKVFAEPTE